MRPLSSFPFWKGKLLSCRQLIIWGLVVDNLRHRLRFLVVDNFRWFPSFALRIPTAHDFASLARANERARVQLIRDFPLTKLDSEINARFLLNEHGDPHFLSYKFNENNILNNWEKHWQKSMATFFANEINAPDRDVTGPTEQVQIMFPLKDKNIN